MHPIVIAMVKPYAASGSFPLPTPLPKISKPGNNLSCATACNMRGAPTKEAIALDNVAPNIPA